MKKSSILIDLQNDEGLPNIPSKDTIESWVQASLQNFYPQLEQTIRVVGEQESQALNHQYRSKDKPTNVLSFPAEQIDILDYQNLGDLVICAPVVEKEAMEQNKTSLAHWAHMVVHGMLHLQGYDHLTPKEAAQMESLEIEILATLGHTNPYLIAEKS